MTADPSATRGGIAACPSAPHRSVLGLVRAAMGRPVGPDLARDLAASDPEALVRIATYAYVHVVVASAFDFQPALARAVPDDLVIYFREMQAANRTRNAEIASQIRQIGARFSALGIRGIVLKGGAHLLSPMYPDPSFRFLSDLDILVPAAEIDRAQAELVAFGAEPGEISEIDRDPHHHLAPLWHPDWPVMVELHRRMGQGDLRDFLAPDAVIASAVDTREPGLSVPAPEYRLMHAVQHAQLQPPRHRDRQLSLRDVVEVEVMLASMTEDDVGHARAAFGQRHAAAWAGLDAARAMIFGDAAEIGSLPPGARRWADEALADFGRPGSRRLATAGRWAGWYAKEFLTNPARRRHYLEERRRAGGLRRLLAQQRERWRRTR